MSGCIVLSHIIFYKGNSVRPIAMKSSITFISFNRNGPSITTPVTSPFHFHLWGPLRDFCFLYTNARIKCVISHLKRRAASLIRSLSSSPSGMSPERAGIQKDTLLFQINNINIFCSTVHPHLIQVHYSTWKILAFQQTSLKKKCVGAAALLYQVCSGAIQNTCILPEATRGVDLLEGLITPSWPPCILKFFTFSYLLIFSYTLLNCQDIE